MLNNYLTDTKNLLQNPTAPSGLYDNTSLTRWINIARGQVAGEAECIRVLGTLTLTPSQRNYNFSSINVGVPGTTGVQGVLCVRDVLYTVGSGFRKLAPRPWEWFLQYKLNNVVPVEGEPRTWAQFGQGAATPPTGNSDATGSFYLDPPPDQAYTLTFDCVCYPVELVNSNTVEAIPYQWTDAVPFFAAYYAYLSAQTGARQADAERMFTHYQTFLERARKQSNPDVLRWQYSQATDPTQLNKLGLSPKQAPAAGAG